MNTILATAKAWAALVGGIVTALLATVPPQTQTWQILTYVAAVATAIATYAVPNLDPKAKRQAQSVQPPE
jgi:hypothetical protein